jgi:hypothetical protein
MHHYCFNLFWLNSHQVFSYMVTRICTKIIKFFWGEWVGGGGGGLCVVSNYMHFPIHIIVKWQEYTCFKVLGVDCNFRVSNNVGFPIHTIITWQEYACFVFWGSPIVVSDNSLVGFPIHNTNCLVARIICMPWVLASFLVDEKNVGS